MKKFLLPLLLLFLLLPVTGWGATYYASPTGSGTECSLANPCTLAYTYTTKSSNGDTIKIGYGSYDIALYLSKTLTFEGTSELGSGTEVLWENTATDQNTIINNSGGLNTFGGFMMGLGVGF